MIRPDSQNEPDITPPTAETPEPLPSNGSAIADIAGARRTDRPCLLFHVYKERHQSLSISYARNG
jgi:hypothetical protein